MNNLAVSNFACWSEFILCKLKSGSMILLCFYFFMLDLHNVATIASQNKNKEYSSIEMHQNAKEKTIELLN